MLPIQCRARAASTNGMLQKCKMIIGLSVAMWSFPGNPGCQRQWMEMAPPLCNNRVLSVEEINMNAHVSFQF